MYWVSLKFRNFLLLVVVGAPQSVDDVIAHLACRLSRWDDRLYRKSIFGASDEVELKFVHRRNSEDLKTISAILNQEIRILATQVIRVKWSLHAREEIVFELIQHVRGNAAKTMLERIRKSTREMRGARSSSWPSFHNSRRHAEHSLGMVAG